MDWLDLLAVQGTLKSLLQHHSSKVSILRCSAFFMVQCSHLYMTTGKTIALTTAPPGPSNSVGIVRGGYGLGLQRIHPREDRQDQPPLGFGGLGVDHLRKSLLT